MERTYKDKLSNLSMLIELARKDGILKDIEIEFFLRIAKRLKVKKEDYDLIIHGAKVYSPPVEEIERVVLFHNLVILSYIDSDIDEKEINFCYELGLKLGLNTEAVRDILTRLKDEPKVAIDPVRVDKLFKSHLN